MTGCSCRDLGIDLRGGVFQCWGSGGVRTGAWSSFENNKVGNPLFARMNILEMFKICFCYIC